jgi:hypothetical protein
MENSLTSSKPGKSTSQSKVSMLKQCGKKILRRLHSVGKDALSKVIFFSSRFSQTGISEFRMLILKSQSVSKSLMVTATNQQCKSRQAGNPITEGVPPLLRLPAELRQIIYASLVPNATIIHEFHEEAFGLRTRPPVKYKFRRNGECCCTALLRTNR